MKSVNDIRVEFKKLLQNEDFIFDKTGVKLIEIIGAQFVADEPFIFGKPNEDYLRREMNWYISQSLNVNDIEEPIPKIWKQVADEDGNINSNYGYLVFSNENGNQYFNVINELRKYPNSRRAQIIYTRPSMWKDYNKNGKSDFCCTSSTQHFIRNGLLVSYVSMRSGDVIFGYNNDFFWQEFIHKKIANELEVPTGKIIWNVGSFHIYERHFVLIN